MNLGINPWTGNRYAFAGGNPIGLVENDGHTPVRADHEINQEESAAEQADEAGVAGSEQGAQDAADLAGKLTGMRRPYLADKSSTSVGKVWSSATNKYKIKLAVAQPDAGEEAYSLPAGWEEVIRKVETTHQAFRLTPLGLSGRAATWHSMGVKIAGFGYEQDPLTDGMTLLGDQLFWPTYLSSQMTPEDDSLTTRAFGVDSEQCYQYYSARLTDSDAWPVFRLGLRDRHEINVVFCNIPGEHSCDFLICRPGGEHPVRLTILGGHEFRPGLSWPELVTAAQFTGAPYGVTDPEGRLLLLLPAFGDQDLPPEATEVVTAALVRRGAGPGAEELAAHLLRKPAWWPHWRADSGISVSDGRYSTRNPAGPAALSADDLTEVSTALAPTA
ncbi:hypothetical protein BJY16_007364 [Actinoplanes octamycinicus]|uniref:Uncharacterized protein n=1 Tax=Actinoplanes octamycinicus TaxID=135948 RepID=A0A7W7H4L4_9ACTN|nr:hypothetical protein [Actinoplanes octamycinicus]MBB4743905.1 hypothetical protein [Actinoplanes octamycinicus]GIE58532.1 hypothetical protein Aoc01nite_39340 [Actinoplanes octamycinicus]